ncbi:MAG: HD domain-containing protein [Spirochaetaceae bacterium]|nr:MAG: HD domain-containing protein [Spirochaetaceae bacterium]
MPTQKHLTAPSFLDEKYILLSPETPFSESLKHRMIKWGFEELHTEGEISEDAIALTGSAGGTDSAPLLSIEEGAQESRALAEAQRFYSGMLGFTEKLFTDFATRNELPQRPVSEKIKELVEAVRARRKYLLRFPALQNVDKNYVIEHSVKTTILSVAMGATLRFPPHKLIELGTAALLHESGLVRLPPQLYMSEARLSDKERKALTAHTLLGFKQLKQFSYPLSVCIAVLECRENVDGSGYPRAISGERISVYAKVIAVAGSYAAMTADRPYRKARDPHETMLELLRDRGKKYDEAALRALLLNLSLFPLGTSVELANGYRGLVIDAADDNPKAPVVRIMVSASGERYADQPMVQTSDPQYRVVRALSSEEARALR